MEEIIIESIHGKPIYIFDDHATALIPWAECRRHFSKAPNLITLDWHTDTRKAFRFYLGQVEQCLISPASGETSEDLCGKIEFHNPSSVRDAVARLKHDEHIQAAILADIIDYAFVISYYGNGTKVFDRRDYQKSENILTRSAEDKILIIDRNTGFNYFRLWTKVIRACSCF